MSKILIINVFSVANFFKALAFNGRMGNLGMNRTLLIIAAMVAVVDAILFISGRIELAYYNLLLLLILGGLLFVSRQVSVHPGIAFGFLLVGILNALGGLIFIDGIRLYDVYFGFLKIDMLIHFVAVLTFTLLVYTLLVSSLKPRKGLFLAFTAMMFAMGGGALFEILELLGIVVLNNAGVGGYFNNAIDLVSNFAGATVAALLLASRKYEPL